MSILDFFDTKQKRHPRQAQADVLKRVEKEWDNYDIFCIRIPTGGGKTCVSDCVAAWRASKGQKVHVLVPDNLLLKQAETEMCDQAKLLWAKRFYKCSWKGLDDRVVYGHAGECPSDTCKKRFSNGCPYTRARGEWLKSKIRVSNYWMPVAHKTVDKCDVLVVDECFAAGTMVDTPNGKKAIEHIVVGDKVLNCVGEATVGELSRSVSDTSVIINGSIECTRNHPFFTTRGWVRASDLNNLA